MFMHTFIFVFIAEMADKTQFMIMALTNRYKLKTILIGMCLGVFIISAFSVLCGNLIGDFVPIWIVKACGALLFLSFGILTLLKKEEEQQDKSSSYRFPILSIATTFLFAELGDKTQLATVALAADHTNMQLQIFCGASLGLIMANVIGIFAGKFLFSHISDNTIRIVSSFIFLFFGSITIFELLPYNPLIIFSYSVIIILIAYFSYQHSIRYNSIKRF